MSIKDVIAQAEKKFKELFKDTEVRLEIDGTSTYETDGKRLKEFIFSTYTKDLLQSVEEMAEGMEKESIVENPTTKLEFVKEGFINGWNSALSDIINNLK